jgi:hypothetical protein
MSRIHVARFDVALEALAFVTGWAGGWFPVERRREDRTRVFWRAARAPGLSSLVRALDERYSDEIAFGLPQPRRFNGGVSSATVLWAWVEGADQVARAQRFRPRPSIVLRAGQSSRRLLIWPLEHEAGYVAVQEANRKLSYALRARQKEGDPDLLWIPCPGTCLRVGRSRPVPVVCSRLSVASFELAAVVGRLREPPARDAWMTGDVR